MLNFRIVFVFATLLLFATPNAWAVLDLHVQETLPVYSSRNKGGREVSTLVKGDVVVISPKIYGNFRKVLVTYDGKRRAGYIQSSKIQRSFIRDRDEEQRLAADVIDYKRARGMGLSLVGSYLRQGSRTIHTSDGTVSYDVNAMTSFTLFFSVFFDYPFADRWVLRPYLTFRQTKFKGDARVNGLSSTLTPTATMSQNLFGLGLLAKRYWESNSNFWYGGALELAKGGDVGVQVRNGINLDAKEKGLAFLAVVQGAMGYDIPLGRSGLFLLPDIRIGAIPNANPFILTLETYLSFGYAF